MGSISRNGSTDMATASSTTLTTKADSPMIPDSCEQPALHSSHMENKFRSFLVICKGVRREHVRSVLAIPMVRLVQKQALSGQLSEGKPAYTVTEQMSAFSPDPSLNSLIFIKFDKQVRGSTVWNRLAAKDITISELIPCLLYDQHPQHASLGRAQPLTEDQARARIMALTTAGAGSIKANDYTLFDLDNEAPKAPKIQPHKPPLQLPALFSQHPPVQKALGSFLQGGAQATSSTSALQTVQRYIAACEGLHKRNQDWLEEMKAGILERTAKRACIQSSRGEKGGPLKQEPL